MKLDDLDESLWAADRALRAASPGPFSSEAMPVLTLRVMQYIRALVAESARVARRQRADVISASHVEHANALLAANTTRPISRHVGTIGGVILGAALSTVMSMASTGVYSTTGVLVSAIGCALGAFGVAWHFADE